MKKELYSSPLKDFTEFFTIKTEKFIAALIIFHNLQQNVKYGN
jgi:ABC-type uncharacterized transport system ATPase component